MITFSYPNPPLPNPPPNVVVLPTELGPYGDSLKYTYLIYS